MMPRRHDARTRLASGRFVFLRAALAATALCVGCASGGPPPEAAAPPAFPDPVLERGPITAGAEARAAGLVREAEEALSAGHVQRAEAAARTVVDEHPTSPVSGQALWVLARATQRRGDLREADAHAQRWARLLAPGDPRLVDARILQGTALVAAGEDEAALRRLLALPPETPPARSTEALGLARAAAAALDASALDLLVRETPAGHPFAPVLLSARARLLYNAGAPGAVAAAEAALAAGAEPPEAAVARGVLEGRADASLGLTGPRVVLGELLPSGGSPVLREYAALVEEGIRAALADARLQGSVELAVADGAGAPGASADGMRILVDGGAVAVVGPLQPDVLDAAVAARTSPVPVVSPTSPWVPGGARHVYTLLGAEPGASRELARWAADVGMRRVALVHSYDPGSEVEARAFAEAFVAAGGTVVAQLGYAPGSTNFRALMDAATQALPDALVVPVPPEDVPVLAPQITFFGLDTLGIHILGTGAWTDEEVLRTVSARHLDGVVAASPDRPELTGGDGYRRFVDAYERTHRKSLRSPVPALGWDAASLLLEALATGARRPEDVARALEGVKGFQGATGVLSVEEGRIVREHRIVCVRSGTLLPVAPGVAPRVMDRRPPPDSTGLRPVLEGLPFARVCPGEGGPPDGVPVVHGGIPALPGRP